MDLQDIFSRISETISSEYNLTGIGKHRGIKGSKRETIIKNFLRDTLPQQYSIGDGEVFNSDGEVSRQVDIIIHNSQMPVFKYSRYLLLYPIESVFGVCEVKSFLDKDRLQEAVENIRTVKKWILPTPSGFYGTFKDRIHGALFAYDSSETNTVKQNLAEIYADLGVPLEEQIDLICVLDKFIAIGNHKKKGYKMSTGDDPVFLNSGKDSLMYFVPLMINGFNMPLIQAFDFFKYIKKLNLPIL
jgi:hypothetical protein